jgi:hypothetical protein
LDDQYRVEWRPTAERCACRARARREARIIDVELRTARRLMRAVARAADRLDDRADRLAREAVLTWADLLAALARWRARWLDLAADALLS